MSFCGTLYLGDSMRFKDYTPLRYPGGKTRLYNYLASIIEHNRIGHYTYVEPFAGGFGVALKLFFNEKVRRLIINDLDRSIYAFWHSILNESEELIKRVLDVNVTIEEWKRQKEIQENKKTASLLDLGFSTFFLNRTNRSGIITGGIIGGQDQNGTFKLDCRFNKIDLVRRIAMIASKRDQIEVYNLDAIEFMKQLNDDTKYFLYLDPPYYCKGPLLYMNHYEHENHLELCEFLKHTSLRYVVSYDDSSEIRSMYEGFQSVQYELFHQVFNKGKGAEIMFFSPKLSIPAI